MRKFVISAALIAAATVAAPASAQSYRYHGGQIERQVDQIENRIHRAAERRVISKREASRLLGQANQIDRLADRYGRDGINSREHRDLQNRLAQLQQQLRWERQDRDGRRG